MISLNSRSSTSALYSYGPVGGSGRAGAAAAVGAETNDLEENGGGFGFHSGSGGGARAGCVSNSVVGANGVMTSPDAQQKWANLNNAAAGLSEDTLGSRGGKEKRRDGGRGGGGGREGQAAYNYTNHEQFYATPYMPPRGIVGADTRTASTTSITAGSHNRAALPVVPSCGGTLEGDNSMAGANTPQQILRRWFAGARHPITCFFHLLFKAAVLLVYLLSGWLLMLFDQSEVFVFVVALVLLAVDFWVVKNVSGRILVGMRWWSAVDAEGRNLWHFEHAQDGREINVVDWRVFWFTNYAWAATWLILAVMALVQLQIFWVHYSYPWLTDKGQNEIFIYCCPVYIHASNSSSVKKENKNTHCLI